MVESRKLGFTLIEVLVVIAILAILASLLMPVFLRGKRTAKEVVTISNLRQLYMALDMYRSDYDGQGAYGDPYVMGLPNPFNNLVPGYGLAIDLRLLESGCDVHPSLFAQSGLPGFIEYTVYNEEKPAEPPFAEYVQRQQDSLVVFQDPNCSDHSLDLHDVLLPKKLIGVTISGSIRRETRTGYPHSLSWWEN